MAQETAEQIRQKMQKLDEQLAEVRAERVAKGLPPDPPPRFVPLPMAWTLFQRLEPLIQYAVKYASLCDKTNEIIDISDEQMAWIKSHEMDVIFINNARQDLGLIAIGIEGIYSKLTRYNENETAGELLRDLVRYITFTRPSHGDIHRIDDIIYDHNATAEENQQAYRKVNAEIERLRDEEYFKEEYRKLIDHYNSVKHLY